MQRLTKMWWEAVWNGQGQASKSNKRANGTAVRSAPRIRTTAWRLSDSQEALVDDLFEGWGIQNLKVEKGGLYWYNKTAAERQERRPRRAGVVCAMQCARVLVLVLDLSVAGVDAVCNSCTCSRLSRVGSGMELKLFFGFASKSPKPKLRQLNYA